MVEHVDRLGRAIKLWVGFVNEANIKFKVELKPEPENSVYSDGEWILPDKHDYHYTEKGHSGNHCYYDLTELDSFKGITRGDCVMFGSNDGGTAFCPECKKILKKMDLVYGIV